MTGGNLGLLLSLCISVFSTLFALGGVLHAMSGDEYGWHAVGVAVTVHFCNCISLAVYFLR